MDPFGAPPSHRHLVDMVYTGHRRLIEPYKLEYYMRKSDGHGSEYFWGFGHNRRQKRQNRHQAILL